MRAAGAYNRLMEPVRVRAAAVSAAFCSAGDASELRLVAGCDTGESAGMMKGAEVSVASSRKAIVVCIVFGWSSRTKRSLQAAIRPLFIYASFATPASVSRTPGSDVTQSRTYGRHRSAYAERHAEHHAERHAHP